MIVMAVFSPTSRLLRRFPPGLHRTSRLQLARVLPPRDPSDQIQEGRQAKVGRVVGARWRIDCAGTAPGVGLQLDRRPLIVGPRDLLGGGAADRLRPPDGAIQSVSRRRGTPCHLLGRHIGLRARDPRQSPTRVGDATLETGPSRNEWRNHPPRVLLELAGRIHDGPFDHRPRFDFRHFAAARDAHDPIFDLLRALGFHDRFDIGRCRPTIAF